MRKLPIVLIALAAFYAASFHASLPVRADAGCYSLAAPTPIPAGLPGFTFGRCINGVLQVHDATGSGATPIPYPTTASGVLLVAPTALPTLSVACVNCPTPLAVQPVSGTFFQATQPVSGSVSVSNFPATQPVSGTVTANAGTGFPTPLAVQPISLPITFQTAFPTPIPFPATQSVTQGTSPWVVNTPAPFSGVVTQGTSPWVVNTPPPFNGVVSGTVTANAGSGTFTVGQATGSNLHTVIDAGVAVIGHVINDASAAVIGHVITDTGSVVNATLQTGANVIGSISNTTFIVTQATGSNLHAVLDAGAAIIGKFGIDQTTPGTTNGVVINSGTTTVTQATGSNLHAVLDAGAAVIGHVIADASAAVIGAVTQSGVWTVQPGNTANTTPWLATINQGGNSAAVSATGALRTSPFLNGAGVSTQAVACDKSVAVNISSATTTQIVAISGATVVYVCGFTLDKSSGAATTFKFVYGTGASCVTGPVDLTGAMDGAAGTFISGGGLGTIFRTAASQALCITTVGAIGIQGFVSYGQF